MKTSEQRRRTAKEWREAHPDYHKRWRSNNLDKCQKYHRKYYQQNKEKMLRGHREWQDVRRRHVDTLKNAPCMDCGGSFLPECMDFDHVRGEKKFAIGSWGAGGVDCSSNEDLNTEIAKCELVCANCHRIRTKQRMRKSS